MSKQYKEIAQYYDKIYSWIDYKSECKNVHSIIRKYKKSKGKEMLDVACGTGNHIRYLKKYYTITGIDLDKEMLKVAKEKIPDVKFYQGDMRTFDLKKHFDVIVCLGAAISKMTSRVRLKQTIKNFSMHLKPGGIMILESFITPESFKPNLVNPVFINEPDLKIYRVNNTKRKGNIVHTDFHILVADKKGVKYITENHKLAMYEHKEFLDVMNSEGLKSFYEVRNDKLMTGRGLYIGIKD